MRCGKCGKDFNAGLMQCPYCQAPVHYGGNTVFYNQAAQNKVNITDFFSNIFSSQPPGAGDKMFISGTALTTPTPDRMLQEWNKPWLYARFLLFGLLLCLLCYFMLKVQGHSGGIFLLFFFGSLLVPLSVLIFYWEINIPRDIPFYRIMMVFFIGGVLSLIFSLLIWETSIDKNWIAALFEEPGKLMALAIFIYWFDVRYIFGGLLIGAAVGAGFAAFEDIFYVTTNILSPMIVEVLKSMIVNPTPENANEILKQFNEAFYQIGSNILIAREIRAVGMHVTWAAIEGGALVMVKGNESFTPAHLFSPRFLLYMAATMFLHFAWNGGLFEGYGLISLITVTQENTESVHRILHAVLCLAAVLLSFTLIRQAIFQVLEVANSAGSASIPASSTFMLKATSGPLVNALFPLEQRITLGRDPAVCNVVFPAGTPGISRRHCVLEPHPDGVYLMDLASTSGTFLQNGQRLPVNQWVKISSNFYLGSPNAMFAIGNGNVMPAPMPTQQSAVSIIGIAGAVQGQRFTDAQRLTIGRDPSQCNVVLPPRTPGVSRRHCVLERQANGVFIMDVGSMAGTFLENGQQLPPNQWVQITGRFYLGSPDVMFAVN